MDGSSEAPVPSRRSPTPQIPQNQPFWSPPPLLLARELRRWAPAAPVGRWLVCHFRPALLELGAVGTQPMSSSLQSPVASAQPRRHGMAPTVLVFAWGGPCLAPCCLWLVPLGCSGCMASLVVDASPGCVAARQFPGEIPSLARSERQWQCS